MSQHQRGMRPLAVLASWARRAPTLSALAGAFVLVALCKWPTLQQPPVWDTAMGVFAPAVYLFRHDFDLFGLLGQPGWMDGGPNVHTLSIWTWIVAGCLRLTRDAQTAFVLLHLLTWLLTAAAGLCLYRLARLLLAPPLALLTCLLTFFLPVVFVQTGYIYLEIPLALCTLAALLAWCHGRQWQAVLLCALGVAIKTTMLAPIAALMVAAALARSPARRRLLILAALLLAPAARLLIGELAGRPRGSPWDMSFGQHLVDLLRHKLMTVPDVYALLLAAPLVGLWRWRNLRFGLRAPAGADGGAARVALTRALTVGTVAMFLLALLTLPLSGKSAPFLPRYAVMILPLAVLAVVDFAAWRLPQRQVVAATLAAICLCVLNLDGRFYRPDHSSFAVVERSMQYRHYLRVQQLGLRALADRPVATPAWFCRADAFLAADPLVGYVDAPLPQAHNVLALPFSRWHLADYPEHFYLLQTNPWHGGEQIKRTLAEAHADPSWRVQTTEFRSGGFRSALHELHRRATQR